MATTNGTRWRSRTTVKDVRRANRAALLRPLLLSGPLNRVALSEITGLSSGSVTNVVADLLAEGLVVEAGTEDSDGGRPRTLLAPNPKLVAIGVDVGETGINFGAFDLQSHEIWRADIDVHPQEVGVADLVSAIAQCTQTLVCSPEFAGSQVLGVGVGVPGIVDQDEEGLIHAPALGWEAVELKRPLEQQLGVSILIDNGAKTLGQAEMWFGAGRGSSNAIVVLLGTGVGAAIFADGVLYRGTASSAGEWGHGCVVVGGRECRCGARGCLEAYVGAEPLIRQWQERQPSLVVPSGYDQEVWISKLLDAAATDPVAAGILEEAATYLGVAAGNLVNILNPERIIIGGWLGLRLGEQMLDRIHDALLGQALTFPAMGVELRLGSLGGDAVAQGAATLAIARLIETGGQGFALDLTQALN